jgi:hypothetical protein
MILMSWRWGSTLPIWPLEAIFTLAAAWFYIRAVHGRHDGTHPDGPRWRDFHHAAMAGALRAARNSDTSGRRQSRRQAAEAAGHALMSIGMAAMFAAMA